MRISDWSSDVCSSDLPGTSYACTPRTAPCARPGRSPRPEQDSVSRSLDRLASSRQSALIKTDPSTSMNRWRAQLEGIRPLDASLAIGQTGKRINGFRPRDIGEPVAAMVSVVRFENVGLRYGTGAEPLRDVNFALGAGPFHFQI